MMVSRLPILYSCRRQSRVLHIYIRINYFLELDLFFSKKHLTEHTFNFFWNTFHENAYIKRTICFVDMSHFP